MKHIFGPFEFDSDFDSGNLETVIGEKLKTSESKVSVSSNSTLHSQNSKEGKGIGADYEFNLWTKVDGIENGTPTKNRTWFHFSVSLDASYSEKEHVTIIFNLKSLNRVQKLLNMGLRPLYRNSTDTKWKRVPIAPTTNYINGAMDLSFQFSISSQTGVLRGNIPYGSKSFPAPRGKYYFAYCIPYSYDQLQVFLKDLEQRIYRSSNLNSKIPKSTRLLQIPPENEFYFQRDVLIKSLDGHNVDILTISSLDGMLSKYEEPPEGLMNKGARLFEKTQTKSMQKEYFVLSARVHPAETIASYMHDGFLDFITSSDPKAALLRSRFIFKIIPMLNPDGVVCGNYRGDKSGMNLNRVYVNPDKERYPTIWAAKKYIEYLQHIGKVGWYIDLHGHANKYGSFLFGNWIPDVKKQYEMLSFARFCYLNNPLFDYSECDFAPKEIRGKTLEQTKDGTGRVAIYNVIQSHHCYTFEANYYGTKHDRRISSFETAKKVPIGSEKRFSLADMKNMGKSIALSLFDMEFQHHPDVKIKLDSVNGVAAHEDWVIEKLKRLYSRARVPLDQKELDGIVSLHASNKFKEAKSLELTLDDGIIEINTFQRLLQYIDTRVVNLTDSDSPKRRHFGHKINCNIVIISKLYRAALYLFYQDMIEYLKDLLKNYLQHMSNCSTSCPNLHFVTKIFVELNEFDLVVKEKGWELIIQHWDTIVKSSWDLFSVSMRKSLISSLLSIDFLKNGFELYCKICFLRHDLQQSRYQRNRNKILENLQPLIKEVENNMGSRISLLIQHDDGLKYYLVNTQWQSLIPISDLFLLQKEFINEQDKPFIYLEGVSQMIQLRSVYIHNTDDELLKTLHEFQDYCVQFISKRWLNYTKQILSLPIALSELICGLSQISLADIKARDSINNKRNRKKYSRKVTIPILEK